MSAKLPKDPLAAALLAWLLVQLGLNLGLALALPAPWNETLFVELDAFARGRAGEDSWGPMGAGLAHLESGDARPVYQAVLFDARIKFQYPPSSLLALELFRWAAQATGLPLVALLNAASWLAVLATLAASAALLRAARPPASPLCAVLLTASGLVFYPLLRGFGLGQIQTWISAALALLLLFWRLERRLLAGVLLGLVCLLKPHFALVGLWALLRRERRFLGAALVTGGVGLAASLLRYGLANHLDYLTALAYLGRHGESFHPNQSLMGLLHRLLGNGNNAEWVSDAFPPFHPAVFGVATAGALLLLLLALAFRAGAPGRASAIDLAGMLLACTMASPIAWEHHYGVLLPVFALLATELARPGASRTQRLALFVAALFAASHLAATRALAATPWNPLQSSLYFAALTTFALLLLRRER